MHLALPGKRATVRASASRHSRRPDDRLELACGQGVKHRAGPSVDGTVTS